jgi:sugar lactone lactonase YvrE
VARASLGGLVACVGACAAAVWAAACSLVTSFNGLEAAGTNAVDAAASGSDASVEADAAGPADSGPDGGTDVGPASDDGMPTDEGNPTDTGACSPDVAADPLNCGACGHSCLGGDCMSGECQPVVLAATNGSVGIAIDSTFVYWADSDAGAIRKVSKALTRIGMPSTVASGAAAQSVQSVASDGSYVYWTNKGPTGQVRRALPTGAAMATIATNQNQPDWIASNGTTVAWTNQGSNQVMSAPAGASSATPTQLNVTGENGTLPAGIAIDSANVYYATKTAGGGLAEAVPLTGGPVSELGTATYVGIAADATNVYWTGGFSNPIVSQNTKAGTTATVKIIATGAALTCPLGIASDGANVYFLDQGTTSSGTIVANAGALYRIPIGNGGTLPPPLVRGLTDPQGIAVDDSAVYWVTGGLGGSVMKLAK